MEFALVNPDKLKVTLTPEDLGQLGVDYESLDYADENTRRVLIELLDKGRASAGFQPRKAKLYIEVYPREDGGCVIYYTRLAGGEVFPAGRFVPGPSPIAFAFEDTQVLLTACAKAYTLYRHRILKSSLFEMEDGYRLIIYPLDYNDRLSVSFLSEYGSLVGEGAILAAYIEEHGRLILEEKALDALAKVEDATLE